MDWRVIQAIPPCTPLTSIPAPTDRPLCRVAQVTYSAYHWPTATPSGEAFCDVNWVAPTGTPTITGISNTAVVSGLTLTSPDVYHVFEDLRIETYRGRAEQPSGIGPAPFDVWDFSTIISAATVAQPETSILQASAFCQGKERDQCTMYFAPDFRIQDVTNVRVDAFSKYSKSQCESQGGGVLYQDCYQPTLAVPISEVATQNGGIFEECEWPLYEVSNESGETSYTMSSVAAILVKDVKATAFVPVTAEEVVARDTAVPRPGFKEGGRMETLNLVTVGYGEEVVGIVRCAEYPVVVVSPARRLQVGVRALFKKRKRLNTGEARCVSHGTNP
jgi:hypothetical protein